MNRNFSVGRDTDDGDKSEQAMDRDWLRSFKIQQKEAERRAKQDQRALDNVVRMETENLERVNRIEFVKQSTRRKSVEDLIINKHKKAHYAELEKKRAINIAEIEKKRQERVRGVDPERRRQTTWKQIDEKIRNAKERRYEEMREEAAERAEEKVERAELDKRRNRNMAEKARDRLLERRRSSLGKLDATKFFAQQFKAAQEREKSNSKSRDTGASPSSSSKKKKKKKRNQMEFIANSYSRANFTTLLSFSSHQY